MDQYRRDRVRRLQDSIGREGLEAIDQNRDRYRENHGQLMIYARIVSHFMTDVSFLLNDD